MKEPDNRIVLDIDRDRIRSILSETYTTSEDILGTGFDISREEFVAKIEPYLESNRVASVPVYLDLPTRKFPGMRIRVHIQKKKVFAMLHPKSKQVHLNRCLKVL